MKKSELPRLDFDEDKINFLLENADKLQNVLTRQEINSLVNELKKNLSSIERIIEELKNIEGEN